MPSPMFLSRIPRRDMGFLLKPCWNNEDIFTKNGVKNERKIGNNDIICQNMGNENVAEVLYSTCIGIKFSL